MPFLTDYKTENGNITGQFNNVKKITLDFTADATGDVGSKTINFGGLLLGVATTDEIDVVIGDMDNVNLIGSNGTSLLGRYTFPVAVPVVGGLVIEVSNATPNTENKVIIYVR